MARRLVRGFDAKLELNLGEKRAGNILKELILRSRSPRYFTHAQIMTSRGSFGEREPQHQETFSVHWPKVFSREVWWVTLRPADE